ncbi:adenylate/guanylate cyclase domain-containing protein [Thiosulfativibrio zosterae]|uniref:Adenylate/guanylate cyclase domain-containing protein n=1 Tax=Thiosulfativibrio zosterae TaxID=2675053 RepID=A0A6F8PQI9_9GAMM|nr:adenylate/guanylate cyclase domain-containing protein [Thiosulfativibrio zosterae]
MKNDIFKQADRLILDKFTELKAINPAPQDIIIIDIDDQTLDTFGEWPWSRELFATFLEKIAAQNPKQIGLDIVFPNEKSALGDSQLSQIIQTNHICLATAFDYNTENKSKEIGQIKKLYPYSPIYIEANGVIGNFENLTQKSKCLGHISPIIDSDGKIRRIPTWVNFHSISTPNLALAMALSQKLIIPKSRFNKTTETIPFNREISSWIVVPAQAILYEQIPSHIFENKWILIGSSALGLGDRVSTPINPWLPGVIIHAELLANFLEPEKSEWNVSHYLPVALTITMGLIILFSFLSNNSISGITIALFSIAAWLYFSWLAWINGTNINPSLVPINLILLLAFLIPYQWFKANQQNSLITDLFKDYLAPNLVDKLISNPENSLTPQKRVITVLFADIEGFTAISQNNSPQLTADLAQKALMVMTDCAQKYDATIDKYIGDELMAFWNAPFEQPNHADLAIKTALEILQQIEVFNQNNPGFPTLKMRIGISTGEVIVGNLGTPFRSSYTAIGYTVNKAHELVDKSKLLNTQILICKNTYLQASKPLLNNIICHEQP